ncbi:cathepsin L1-like [Cimex lectularius]|uniref:Cathepsin L-like cysteine protease n=1 Tax=Cimex lectularius TaxID=79782 RepID=A0A8I6R6H2_CIMLE|nr:cathepsin L1-like [Cimex lectularius]
MQLFIFVCVISSILAESDSEWEMFKKKYNRTYNNDEYEAIHREVFISNKKAIDEHNAKYEKGLMTYSLKINHFADFTPDEIKALFGKSSMEVIDKRWGLRAKRNVANESIDELVPDYVDWVKKGAVTPIKDQGLCGSCYIFSSLAALESQLFLKRGKLVSLSAQNFLDCAKKGYEYNENPCLGGSPLTVFDFIENNRGLATESSYPYEEKVNNCTQEKIEHFKITRGNFVPPNSIKWSIFKNGPVITAYDATQFSYLFYSSGIYEDPACNSTDINHASVLVGFGTEERYNYWLVKNSWGTDWGEDGYARIAMNERDFCGIQQFTLAVIAH